MLRQPVVRQQPAALPIAILQDAVDVFLPAYLPIKTFDSPVAPQVAGPEDAPILIL